MANWQSRVSDDGNNTSDWQKMLSMYQLAGNNDASTMFGFALGKLLNQAWMEHIAKRHDDEYKNWQKAQDSANALTGTTGTPLGQVAQRYAMDPNNNALMSNALAAGVASGKIKPEFAEALATGGWNVGNDIPDYLKQVTGQATTKPATGLLGDAMAGVDPNSALGKYGRQMNNPTPLQVASEMAGNGSTTDNANPYPLVLGKMWNSYTPKNNTYTTGSNYFSMG